MKHRKQLIKLSKYYYNKEGIVTDIYDLFKTLPILNFSVNLNNEAIGYKKNKNTVDKFIKTINVKKLARKPYLHKLAKVFVYGTTVKTNIFNSLKLISTV